jgi:hypothetical protein
MNAAIAVARTFIAGKRQWSAAQQSGERRARSIGLSRR